jgi:hypothetical protein
MVLSSSIRLASFVTLATAFFAGCGSGVTPPPATALGALDDSLGASWMDPSAIHRRLLYVSAQNVGYTGAVYVYGYDNPTKLVGKLTGFSQPKGQCTNKAGDVFITDALKQRITEYRHAGTKPIATFDEHFDYMNPIGCAVDPKSGKLAVANAFYYDSVSTMGGVTIWTNPSRAKTYGLPFGLPGPPAYDAGGDLFIEGFANPPPTYGLEELPAGASTFKKITLQGAKVGGPDGVMWDGHYFVLTLLEGGSHEATGLYRVQVSGSVATVVSEVKLADSCDQKPQADVPNPWIEGNVVSGGNNACKHRFDYWNYAEGGTPIRSIPRAIAPAQSEGEAVSE